MPTNGELADEARLCAACNHLLKWPLKALDLPAACDAGKNVDGSPGHKYLPYPFHADALWMFPDSDA